MLAPRWLGRTSFLIEPLAAAIGEHVPQLALHADDTPVPVLDPGRGKTKTDVSGPWCATSGRGAAGPHRSPSTPTRPTARVSMRRLCCGLPHADGYAGLGRLYERDAKPDARPSRRSPAGPYARRKIFEALRSDRLGRRQDDAQGHERTGVAREKDRRSPRV